MRPLRLSLLSSFRRRHRETKFEATREVGWIGETDLVADDGYGHAGADGISELPPSPFQSAVPNVGVAHFVPLGAFIALLTLTA